MSLHLHRLRLLVIMAVTLHLYLVKYILLDKAVLVERLCIQLLDVLAMLLDLVKMAVVTPE